MRVVNGRERDREIEREGGKLEGEIMLRGETRRDNKSDNKLVKLEGDERMRKMKRQRGGWRECV